MIATVSPCNVYLEETLSTLRYAQQARMIVNHNYINEDPTAMIIRSLKEEVERLRLQHIRRSPSLLFEGESMEDEEVVHEEDGIEKEKALMERENAIIQKEEEKNQAIKEKEEEIAILQEKLRCQQLQCKQLLIQNNRSLERRLTEAEAQRQQALESLRRLGIANEKETGPVLINLSEDPQLSETLSYRLKNGTTTIGHSDCDLTLRGLHTDSVHCSILNDSGHLQLHPKINTDTYVNGKLVTSPQKLHHNDRLVLAGIYYFRMNSSKDSSLQTSKNMDFYFTKEELLKEQEKRLQREAEMVIASSKAEMEQEMCHQRDRLMNDIQEARNQLMNKQQLVCELEGTQWKLEAEKRLLEEQILRDRKNSQPLDLSLQSTTLLHSNILQEVEAIFNESVQEVRKETTNVTLPILSLRIKEANQICKKLKKPYEFMMQEILNETGLEVVVLMKDLPHQMTATLTRAAFKKKLQVLRDIIQGEEYEDEMFETSLQWERTEDLSCVPGFVNKLLECPSLHTLNTSLNCSISAPSSILPRLNTSRRNNMLLGVEHSNIASNSEMTACKGSVTVAATVHWALASLPTADPLTPPLTTALNAVADLYGVTVHIRDHITEPGHTLADGDLSRKLIHLYHSSQTAVSSLLAVVSNENTTDCKEGVQLQDKLRRAAPKITNCASRIFQGVKNEVDSLVEEECGTLTSLAQTLVADIAKLALLAPLPVPTFTKLIPGGVLFKKFTDGLRNGLDWLVINSGKTASKTTVLLAAPTCKEVDRSESCDALSLACQSATSAISAFLKKFAQLNATLNYDQSLPEDEQTRKIILWVNRVESAADTITQLTVAVLAVMNHITLSQQGKLSLEDFKNVVEDLLTRLQYLMHFAGVSPTPIDDIEDCSFSSNSDLENSREFMDNLHTVAWRSVQAVENIQNILNTSNNSSESKSSTSHVIKYNKKHLTQWPRNSQEYQKLLQKLAEQKQSQMKSSLRSSTGVPSEEKRVRFDVSCTSSSSSVSCVEEIDI